MTKLIIRKHRPFFFVTILIASVAITFFIQRYIFLKTTEQQQLKIKEYQQLEKLYKQSQTDNTKLNNQLATDKTVLADNRLELNLQKETIQQLEQQLNKQQQQLAKLNKELLFYQTITQGERPNKLQIREFTLHSDKQSSDIVYYQLVITQGKKINQALKGTVEIASKDSEGKLNIIAQHPLNLRHVQLIEDQIKITDEKVPDSIIITIKQKKKTLLSQSFAWQISPSFE